MKVRFKTYNEFLKGIIIAHRSPNGVVIICKLKRFTIMESWHPLWNTRKTKTSFLVKLYIEKVLWEKNISKKIQRIEGFELLGKIGLYRGHPAIIVNAVQVVDSGTGEIDMQLTVANKVRSTLFKILKSEIQL